MVLRRPALAGEVVDPVRGSLRQPVDERQPRVHLDREPPIGRRQEHAPADAERLRHEEPLPLDVSHVLDHRVRVDDVERLVAERERATVALDVGDIRIPEAEARAFVEAEGRDPLTPGVELLEDVVRPTARLAPFGTEPDLVDADIENRRVGGRTQLVHEKPKLPPARAQ